MPATPFDAKGLLKAAIREDNPVLFIEHKMIYNSQGPVPPEVYNSFRGSRCEKRRKGCNYHCLFSNAPFALQAAEMLSQEGIEAEVIDPRTLVPLDIDTITESVRKTNRVVIVHEGCKTGGAGAEIGMKIQEEVFDYLDAPIVRLGAADAPVLAVDI